MFETVVNVFEANKGLKQNIEKLMAHTEIQLKKFLEEDLFDSLRWLFEGAIAWKAEQEKTRHQKVLAMYTSLVQARSLYDFFFKEALKNDDARLVHFTGWKPENAFCKKYLDHGQAGNKRIFHLVYNRSQHNGGESNSEHDHLKEQVLEIAKTFFDLTKEFVNRANQNYKDTIQQVLNKTILEAREAAEFYGIDNPFKLSLPAEIL